jgi:molybdenum cofactor cytidylyltransferase
MPENKLLASLNGKPVIRRTVESVCSSLARPVIVVTGHAADSITAGLTGLPVKITKNDHYAEGLSASLKCGVSALPPDCDGFLVVLGDMPFVPVTVFDAMIRTFESHHRIVVPIHKGRRGNPVLWPAVVRGEFGPITGDKGAKALMVLHGELLYELEVGTDAIFADLDRPEDFARG